MDSWVEKQLLQSLDMERTQQYAMEHPHDADGLLPSWGKDASTTVRTAHAPAPAVTAEFTCGCV